MNLSTYKKQLDLEDAECIRIDHADTMIAHVYRVTQTGKEDRILKVCPRTGDFTREKHFLKLLAGTLPVPKIIASAPPGALLIECLKGDLLQEKDWTSALASEVGVVLARLHSINVKTFGDPTKPKTLTPDPKIYFGQKFEEELDECRGHLPQELIEKCQNYYDSHLHHLAAVDGPCIVHRDFRPGNLIVDNGKLQGVTDWASGRLGFAEQDFINQSWPPSFLKGYASQV
jgi:aminoglycoside phosphotransferase (APT) family kinase protein